MKNPILVLIAIMMLACKQNPGRDTREKISYIVDSYAADSKFVGNVLVAISDSIIYEGSKGFSDAASGKLNTDSTRFLIASLSKPLTAVMILRLIEKKVIQLDDRLGQYFNVKHPDMAKVTIHQLLTHTSGISDFIGKAPRTNLEDELNQSSAAFNARQGFKYANSGYVLLTAIAGKATGKTYHELMTEQVFSIAGMKHSGVARQNVKGIIALGYTSAAQSTATFADFPLENVDGAGSVYATTKDLFAFDNALRTGKLLSKESLQKMFSQQVFERYGYGWYVRERGGQWDTYWQQGNLQGYTSYMSRNIRSNKLIVVLSNAENIDLSELERDISKVLKKDD